MKTRSITNVALGTALTLAANLSQAAGLADITAAVNFTDVVTAIFAIGVIIVGVDLAQIGYMKARKLIKGAH